MDKIKFGSLGMILFIHDIHAYHNDKPLKFDYIVHGINNSCVTRLLLTVSFYVTVWHYFLRIPRKHIFLVDQKYH